MDDTDRLVAAIFAATMAFKRNISKTDEFLVYYDHFLHDLEVRAEKLRAAATAATAAAEPAPAGTAGA